MAQRGSRRSSEKGKLVEGIYRANPKGFGFVSLIPPGDEDVFISPRMNRGAIHGDKVLIRYRRGHKGLDGEVHRILERRYPAIVGVLHLESQGAWVVPDNPKFGDGVSVSRTDVRGARAGQKVMVKITKSIPGRRPLGEITEVLGNANDPGVAIAGLLKGSGLSETFPKSLLAFLPKEPPPIRPSELEGREDLRGLDIVTIDGEDAKDFDDAIHLEKRGALTRIGVHIADVSHYVVQREHLDQEAYARATSVYLVDRVLPMLPEVYSNGMCSLQANQDRLTISAFMDVDAEGQIVWYKLVPSVIRVRRRLTYRQVSKMLDGEELLYPALKGMKEIAETLYQRRLRDGTLDFDLPESRVRLDDQGRPVEIVVVPRLMSHRIVEELMLAANETVAKHLSRLDVPGMYRIHEPPNEEDLNQFRTLAHNLGVTMPKAKKVDVAMLQQLLASAKGRPAELVVNTLMLRAMKLAVYSPKNKGHFGLGKTHYLHFTSPIRRYPDLVVHRVLRESWKPQPEQRWEPFKQGMAEWAVHCSERERLAEEVEDQTVKLKKLEYMTRHLGQVFEGVICGVQSFGIFVEMKPYLIEGLVHITNLPGRTGYVFDESTQTLTSQHPGAGAGKYTTKPPVSASTLVTTVKPKTGRHQFRLGDPIRVKIARVAPAQGQLDLVVEE